MAHTRKRKTVWFHSELWGSRQVMARTVKALDLHQAQFELDHRGDPDDAPLAYLRQAATSFGVPPCAEEFLGGPYIARRFGCWENAVAAAGLEPPHALPPLKQRRIYQREFKRQTLLYKQERAYQA